MMGELTLDGHLRPIKGVLPIAVQTKASGFQSLIVPSENAKEAAVVDGLDVYGFSHIKDIISFLEGNPFETESIDIQAEFNKLHHYGLDFSDVKGQQSIKRCMEIAAAGGHNIIMIGPPGSGKTMLAKRLPAILPPMDLEEALETTKIHSVIGGVKEERLLCTRPFRSPHHTISDVALVGGGSYPQPGEKSLAHNGVLFLDELPEFKRSALEVMRQPLEDREVTISRAKFTVCYPASFMLVASMNPSPSGYFNDDNAAIRKSCAIRCISGGIPPILRVKQQEEYVYYILQSEGDEDINQSILSFVGEPVSVQGQEYTHNGWSVLITSADKIEYK